MSIQTTFLALSIGNTTTSLANIKENKISDIETFSSQKSSKIIQSTLTRWKQNQGDEFQIIIASSNEKVSQQISATLGDQTSNEIWEIGKDLPVAIGQHLDPETITGTDRLLNAAAAWSLNQQATVIVDAGTCVTVDFVDGEGTFHGGAIAPGAAMQLQALHKNTDSLPDIAFKRPLKEAFGKNTAQAMLQGVFHGIRGMVRQLTEQYASRYGAYPSVIATGGDATLLFENDEFVEQIIPDLLLQGIASSISHALTNEENE